MPRFEKWLVNVAPETPVDRVARKALALRLRAVAWYLDAAIADEDQAESIHQLRIWTRRAAAALRLFAPTLFEKPAKQLKKTLRKLRRAAGAVRDCDVHRQQLQDDSDQPPKRLIAKLNEQHRQARRELKACRKKLLQGHKLERQSAAVLDSIAWPKRHSSCDPPAFAAWCRRQLIDLSHGFFALAALDPTHDRQLHELRKAGKQLRYALELAAAAIPQRTHRHLYDELSALQDRLGAVCDDLVAAQQIRDWQAAEKKPKHQQQLADLLARVEQRLAKSRRQFHRWWSSARRTRWQQQWHAILVPSPTGRGG